MKLRARKVKAVTLMEVLVVMVIIGIITMMIVPKVQNQVTSAKALEAKGELKHLYSLQKTYFLEHSKYSGDLYEVQYESQPLVTNGGAANYRIEIKSATPSTFQATATAVVDFDQDGTYNVWSINEKMKLREEVRD